MAQKKVLIIGAGIAGLAAGCYAQMNGYAAEIFELHDLPGGLCTAWERKGYTLDGCIHYLFGTAPGQPFNQVWQELGVAQQWTIHQHEALMHVVDAGGRRLPVYADPDRLEAAWCRLAPEDAPLIADFAAGIRQFTSFDMAALQAQPRELMGADDWRRFGMAVMPYLPAMARWGRLSAQRFAEQFTHPLLRRALPLIFGWPDVPVMVGMSLLAYMHLGNAGFPSGGSLRLAQAIEQRYLGLGGTIHYKSQVDKILVENDRAVGVRLYNDDVHRGDAIISAMDGRGTLFDLLDGAYLTRGLRRLYAGNMPLHSQVQVSLGVTHDISADPYWTTYLLEDSLQIGGVERPDIGVKHYCFDRTMAPAGHSVLTIMLPSSYAWWQRIYGRKLYDMEQLQVADQVLGFLEQRYPGLREAVVVKDVATPLSYERYTGNWQGATCGWLLTDKTMMMMIRGLKKRLPGLRNLYLAGQWVEPGGSVPIVAMSGRNAVQLLCAADGHPFTAETPMGAVDTASGRRGA
jgi:phytoene dehydrogenase-like protein